MRSPHPFAVLLLALLFAGQSVAATVQCAQIEGVVEHACCGETAPPPAPHDCGCYDAPEQPVTNEPVIEVQPTPIAAALSAAADPAPEPAPRRQTRVEAFDLPAPPSLRAHDVRAPPVLW